jgi:hypothetical protein
MYCLGVSKKFNDCEMLHSRRIRGMADYPGIGAVGSRSTSGQLPELNMIKISGYPIGAILYALQAATGPPASALERWVELTNNTQMTIVEIYISQVGAEIWNIDLLSDFLTPASSVLVNIDDLTGCRFDVKTVFDDGTTQIRRGVDVCRMERYAISYR